MVSLCANYLLVIVTFLFVLTEGLQLQTRWPEAWQSLFSRAALDASQQEADVVADQIKDAFRHAWKGYIDHAAGADDLKPVSGGQESWINDQNTLIDALPTLWIMGLKPEFEDAKKRVAKIRFDKISNRASVFETTIRDLGGLCSAHSLSGDPIFLTKAKELADHLLPCLQDPAYNCNGLGNDAERGSVQLEFRYVSQQTGDPRYQQAADKLFQDLLAGGINVYSMGGGADSYYEYMLKLYVQSGKREPGLKDAWLESMDQMQSNLVKTTALGSTFVTNYDGSEMEHLTCFVGGMLALGAHNLPTQDGQKLDQFQALGENITDTCYKFTRITKTGLAPERVLFDMESKSQDMLVMKGFDTRVNILRPEVIESIFYQHYYTGDPKYREWAKNMFLAFNTSSRTEFGFAEVIDVDEEKPRLRDKMESFFLAETLMYLYLTMAPPSTIDLDKFVFNTEAHPLRINPDAPVFFEQRVETKARYNGMWYRGD